MILSTLLIMEIISWQSVACTFNVNKKNFDDSPKTVYQRRIDENSILNEMIRENNGINENQRFKRDATMLNSTETSIRFAYDRAMNQTITDYYAQRKAVMERYYARQREIVDKFGRKTATQLPRIATMIDTTKMRFNDVNSTTRDTIVENTTRGRITTVENTTRGRTIVENTTRGMIAEITTKNVTTEITRSDRMIESTTISSNIVKNEKTENVLARTTILNESEKFASEKNNSNVPWIYRMNNWNPKILENDKDMDFQAESSNILPIRADKSEIPGYYRLGEFKGSDDEKIVYQHNLGVGLKGSSQLEANFEVILEGAFVITVIEAFPYANTRAHFSWISGGPGSNSVKLNLKGYENEGFSYTVKVWGVPI